MKEIILSILLGMSPSFVDINEGESLDKRRDRLEITAQAISEAATNPTEIAALLAQGQGETNFAAYVGEGRCSDGPIGMRCDPGDNGIARAATYWQVWTVSCPEAWRHHPSTLEAQREAAKCTLRLLRLGYRACNQSWIGAFSRAGGGISCSRRYAPQRVIMMNRYESLVR